MTMADPNPDCVDGWISLLIDNGCPDEATARRLALTICGWAEDALAGPGAPGMPSMGGGGGNPGAGSIGAGPSLGGASWGPGGYKATDMHELTTKTLETKLSAKPGERAVIAAISTTSVQCSV